MTRIQKLEAVALAAKEVKAHVGEATISVSVRNLIRTLSALDACPQAEPVEGRPERPKAYVPYHEKSKMIVLEEADSPDEGWVGMDDYMALEAYATTLQAEIDRLSSKQGGWQPISTAPRDGTEILGWAECAGEIHGPGNGYGVVTMSWTAGSTDYPGYDWNVENTDAYAVWCKPTHWMPLPQPPSPHTGLEKT